MEVPTREGYDYEHSAGVVGFNPLRSGVGFPTCERCGKEVIEEVVVSTPYEAGWGFQLARMMTRPERVLVVFQPPTKRGGVSNYPEGFIPPRSVAFVSFNPLRSGVGFPTGTGVRECEGVR